jgi:hypothetical protein
MAAWFTRRNGNIREAEHRLPWMLPVLVISPVALIVYGCTAQYKLHWVGYFFGAGMAQFCAVVVFTNTLTYALDSVRSAHAQARP